MSCTYENRGMKTAPLECMEVNDNGGSEKMKQLLIEI